MTFETVLNAYEIFGKEFTEWLILLWWSCVIDLEYDDDIVYGMALLMWLENEKD